MESDSSDSVDHIYMEKDVHIYMDLEDGVSSPERQMSPRRKVVDDQETQEIESSENRTELDVEITRHEYLGLQANFNTHPAPPGLVNTASVIRTQSESGPPAYYDVFPQQNRGTPVVERQPVRIEEPRLVNTSRRRRMSINDDLKDHMWVWCAFTVSVFALFSCFLCGIPALIIACKDSVNHIYMVQKDEKSSIATKVSTLERQVSSPERQFFSPERQVTSRERQVSPPRMQVSTQVAHDSSQGNQQIQATTTLRTESGVEITRHDYIGLQARSYTPAPSYPVHTVPVIRTQRDDAPPAYYDIFPQQNRDRPIERQPVRAQPRRVNRSRRRRRRSTVNDDKPLFLQGFALLFSLVALICPVCAVPAVVFAVKAIMHDDPEKVRSNARASVCCSSCSIATVVVILSLTKFY